MWKIQAAGVMANISFRVYFTPEIWSWHISAFVNNIYKTILFNIIKHFKSFITPTKES